MNARTRAVWALVWCCCGCGETAPPGDQPGPRGSADLEGGVVARIGDDSVALITVARIATAQGVSLEEARDRAVHDALLAAGARADLPAPLVREATQRVLGHAMLRQLWLELRDQPVSDAELAEATEKNWTRYDRPPGKRTIHFVVQLAEKEPPERVRAAEELAARIREAVLPVAARARDEPAPVTDEENMFRMTTRPKDPIEAPWEEAVKSIDATGFSVLPQALHPITVDGLPIDHSLPLEVSYYDASYAAETAKLEQRGDLSPVFKSYAGYHVAMLLELTPEKRVPREQRLEKLRDQIVTVRVKRARQALVAQIAEQTGVSLPPNADALLALVRAGGAP